MSTARIIDLTPKVTLDGTEIFEISEGGAGSFRTTISAVVANYQLLSEKGNADGYAGLDASQELLLTNFPSGTALQVLRRNAANDALEFADVVSGGGITSINGDTTAAQIIAGTANRISLVDAGATHTFDIDSAYVGQASITTLGTITTGTWNGTTIAITNGGSGQTTQQAAINALTNVAAATNEFVLTKDTATGDAIWKAAAGGSSPPFADTQPIIEGSLDATKLLRFEIDGFTTGTTRVLTPPDADITLAATNIDNMFSASQTISMAGAANLIIESDLSAALLAETNSDIVQGSQTLTRRRGTRASPTTVLNGDLLGDFQIKGYDGTTDLTGGVVRIRVNGAVSTNTLNTDMTFRIGSSGSISDALKNNY